jgi:hypothetical protein
MQTNQAFKVVIAYENLAGAVRAKEMSERLATELESKCDTWKFELLAHPGLRQHAAQEAAEADMIIVALRSAGAFPEHVNEWIRAWAQVKKDSPTILVALLDDAEDAIGMDDEDGADRNMTLPGNFLYLRQVAEERGMDFLSNLDHLPVSPAHFDRTTKSATPADSVEFLLRRRRYEETHSPTICHAV